ncbi:MAG: class I SAM-dependent methyltransferase [Gemmataceae bacterium]|nr:class I SAM-dependent methyltransferase [Gemmataceae bacterium]
MTPGFKDHFSGRAADYRAFRPEYPPALFAFLASAAPGRELAWDCGTGNGQAAVGLAPHFARVFATDASEAQLAQAEPHPRVEYAVAFAEACPLPDRSVDLVTVTQALHWFDLDRFYAEVRRVCRPGGLLATTCYYAPSVGTGIDPVLIRFVEFVKPYWTPERALVDDGYRTVPFPFLELPVPAFEVAAAGPLPHFLGYLGTWSASKQYQRKHGTDPLAGFRTEFAAAWGDPETVRTIRWAFNVRLGRVG